MGCIFILLCECFSKLLTFGEHEPQPLGVSGIVFLVFEPSLKSQGLWSAESRLKLTMSFAVIALGMRLSTVSFVAQHESYQVSCTACYGSDSH